MGKSNVAIAEQGKGTQKIDNPTAIPRSVTIARRGIRSTGDGLAYYSALAADVMDDTVKPGKANAAMRAVEGMAKLFELQHKYGSGTDVDMIPPHLSRKDRLELLEAELKELRAAE